jgi:hypothetical protein
MQHNGQHSTSTMTMTHTSSLRAGLTAFVTYDKRLAAAKELGLPVLSPV